MGKVSDFTEDNEHEQLPSLVISTSQEDEPSIKENLICEEAITNDKFDMEVAYSKGVTSINKREMDEILV